MDGGELVEVGAEINGSKERSHDRTDHTLGGLMWVGSWMLNVLTGDGCWVVGKGRGAPRGGGSWRESYC